MMFLKNIDTILALAAVMLMLSLIITSIVQILSNLFSLRGFNLVSGVSRLFRQLDPAFTRPIAHELSRKLLRHPAVVRPLGRVTQAVSSEEFVRLAKDMAANSQVRLSDDARAALQSYLTKTISNLAAGQQAASAAASVQADGRVNEAVARVPIQKIGADVEQWFDTILNRTRDTFILHTRVVTGVVALLLAFGFRIDTLFLLRQLSGNDEARTRVVESIQATTDQATQMLAQAQAAGAPPDADTMDQQLKNLQAFASDLSKTSLEVVASDPALTSFPGMLMTSVFLGLGAPFWFNLLKQLSSLRPAIAQLVDPKKRG